MNALRPPARTSVPIHELLAHRFSTRGYDPDRPVAPETLTALFEAARWAPSCFNDQPWRFIVWNREEDRAAWERAVACLTTGNQSWARHAPILLLSLARTHFAGDRSPNRWGEHDTGLATMGLLVEAQSRGLSGHPMGGFDREGTRSSFNIPEEFTPMAMVTLGYALPLQQLPEPLRTREAEERVREPLSGLVWKSSWNVPFGQI